MSYTTKNPRDLKDAVLRRLGAPIINIEVTTEQVYDCIARALELYGEYHFDGVNKTYAVFQVGDEQIGNGVFSTKGQNIYAVTQVLRANVGSLVTMDGTAVYPWFQDFLLGLTGGALGSGGCKWYGPNAFGADLGYFTQLMSYRTTMQDMLNPLYDYWYNEANEQLKVVGNFQKGDLVIVEVYVKSAADVDHMLQGDTVGFGFVGSCDDDDYSENTRYNNPNRMPQARIGESARGRENGAYNNRWVKDYTTALVKELNGEILARHQGMQMPGGVTVDGVRLMTEARIEIDKLRDELEMLDPPPPIIMG